VAHTCNLSYFGTLRSREPWLKASSGKKFKIPTQQKKSGCDGAPVIPARVGSTNKSITIQASQGINTRPCLKNNKSKRAGDKTRTVQHLPSKFKALSLNPVLPKPKNKTKQ
jgi:hypothetical protein